MADDNSLLKPSKNAAVNAMRGTNKLAGGRQSPKASARKVAASVAGKPIRANLVATKGKNKGRMAGTSRKAGGGGKTG
jgi:hypothetical protein